MVNKRYIYVSRWTHEDEWNQGQDTPAFAGTSDSDCTHCGLKDQLEETEKYCWYRSDRLRKHIPVEGIFEVPKYSSTLAICQGVTNQEPLN